MTLPMIQPVHRRGADRDKSTSQLLKGVTTRRRPPCFSAAWADPPLLGTTTKKERRRAICSWSVGYGTLGEIDETAISGLGNLQQGLKRGKVAEHSTLLEPRGRTHHQHHRIVTTLNPIPHATPHLPQPIPHTTNQPGSRSFPTTTNTTAPVSVHQTETKLLQQYSNDDLSSASSPNKSSSRKDILSGMPGNIKSLLSRRRGSGNGHHGEAKLVKKEASCGDIVRATSASLASLRKCETVLALTSVLRSSSSSSSIEPLQPVNRLRISPTNGKSTSRMCSRCSSLLTLASTSRYSLNSTAGGFVPVPTTPEECLMLRTPSPVLVLCKLCLAEVPSPNICRIEQCDCAFCIECMRAYVEFEIAEGAYDISCPDAQCPSQGVLQQDEIRRLAGNDLLEKHKKYRLNREVELDKTRTWCPRAGCETVCTLCPTHKCAPQSVFCPTCTTDFCSNCKLEWHEGMTCDENNKQLAREGKTEDVGIPFDSDLIKCCPMCNVPIEKDEGCAQMMCKRCKHVFCWYCLASLDDDFLLRHYDKGPCKNKLGHSRASVIWHRTQVIGIFAGFGILLLVASPLLLLAAPCIVCCKCRVCNADTTKLDNIEETTGDDDT